MTQFDDPNKVRDEIKSIRETYAKYGMLAGGTVKMDLAYAIIQYYEKDGESAAIAEADAQVAEWKAKLAKQSGANGALQRRINKLEGELDELRKVQMNNRMLARVSSRAVELVEYLNGSTFVDAQGDAIVDEPLYVALREEVGIASPDADDQD